MQDSFKGDGGVQDGKMENLMLWMLLWRTVTLFR